MTNGTFKNYSRPTNKYDFKRNFKFYEADKVQDTPELEQLAKQTVIVRNKFITIRLGITSRNSLRKHCTTKKALESTPTKQKIDVEPVFGVRRVYFRGKQAVTASFLFMNKIAQESNLLKRQLFKNHTVIISD